MYCLFNGAMTGVIGSDMPKKDNWNLAAKYDAMRLLVNMCDDVRLHDQEGD